ncbi:uncharacterized protein LOC122249294 [Penaeus japonicus]|uniref:uncharacterized protein LOC122249294 n=1 Tax=Penaeus japonicus TaxID=27405 RepID=UPI001C70DFCB|nr:uncharacterized protein LOC122249294 [Penaeus japonicus]
MLHFEPPPAQQVEENIIRYCHSKGVRLYQDPVGQFARRGRGKFVRASPSGPPKASGMGTPVKDEVGRHSRDGSQGHQEAFCKDGNVPHTSQPSRSSIGNGMLSLRNQGRNGPGTAKNERVPLLPSLVKKKQKSAPSTLQLQNNLQKPLSLGQKNSRNVRHEYQNSSAMADAPRPSPPKPPQVQMVPGFLGSNSLPPGFKIRFIGWPNVEGTLTMNSKDQFIQESETQDKGIDNVTVKGLSHWSQTDTSQKAEMSNTIREDRGKMQSHSSEMSKAEISACKFPFVSTEERDTSKDILSNKTSSTVASSRSKLNSWGFMMPKSRKGLPVNGTTAKEGSEKPSALDGNVPSNCLMESMSTVQGSYEIDLQGVPNQGLVSEDRAATRTHHVETRSYHQQNKWTESEQMEMDPIATLANELRVVTEVKGKTERRWRLKKIFKRLIQRETIRETAKSLADIIRAFKAEQGTDILTAAEEEVFGELGVSLMVECFERHCAEAAVSVISLLLDYDILVYTYLPLQNEVPPSEHRLAVMALDLLHLRGQWDSFMKILEEVYWSGGSTEVRTKLKCLSVVLQTLLTSSGSCDSASHFAKLQNAVKILASLVKYYRYDVQMIRDDYTRIIDLNNILIKTWQMINDSQVPTLMMEAKSLVLEAKSVGIKVPLEVEETATFYDMERQENGSLHAKGGTKKMHQEETGIKGERIYKNQRRPQQPDCAMSRGALWSPCNQEVGMQGRNCKQGSAMLCRDTQGKSFLQGRTCVSLPATGTTSRWDLLHERGASMTVCLQGNKDGNIARNVVMHGQERFGIESQNQSQTPVPGKYTVGGGSFRNRQADLPPPDDVQAHRMKIAMPSRPLGMVKGQSAGRVPTPHTSGSANQQRSEVLGKNSKRFRKVKHKGSRRPLMRQALEAD